ncbi:MAG: hypothetical protein AAFR28_14110 [Pseudomonadota bacterium]
MPHGEDGNVAVAAEREKKAGGGVVVAGGAEAAEANDPWLIRTL